jgi:hypothetical protein
VHRPECAFKHLRSIYTLKTSNALIERFHASCICMYTVHRVDMDTRAVVISESVRMSALQDVLGILATAYDLSGQAQRDISAQEVVFAYDMEEFEVRSAHHHGSFLIAH